MATRSWTAEVFVDHEVGVISPVVQAGTLNGAERQIHALYGPVQQIVNLREVRSGGGGGASSGSGGGSRTLALIGLGLAALAFVGGERTPDDAQGPVVDPEKPSIERLVESAAPIAPPAPVAPQPEFKDYPTPPPSYCITENFEPC